MKHKIWFITIPIINKLVRVLTYCEKSNDRLITRSGDSDFLILILVLIFTQYVGLECKHLSRHRLLVMMKIVSKFIHSTESYTIPC